VSEVHLNTTTKHEIELARILSLLLQKPKGLRAAWRSKGGEGGNFIEVTGRGGIIAFDSVLNIGNFDHCISCMPCLTFYPTATIETDADTSYALQMPYLLAL
jgi:hypothetical protein